MNVAWTKFRSMVRGPLDASAAPPPQPTPAVAAKDGPDVGQTIRAVEERIDALTQRLDALSGVGAEPSSRPGEVGEAAALRTEIDALREAQTRVNAELAAIRDAQARAAEVATTDAATLIELETTTHAVREGLAAATLRDRDLRQSVEFCEDAMRSARQEWLAQAAQRDRELSGRLAGLYIIGIVALLLSLGTLVLCLTK